jgi:amidophosphoribosyltransferase
MATKTEFVATGRDNDGIAKVLGVDHLVYLERAAMNEAARAGNPKIEKFCNACFTGEYPTGDITLERMNLIASERETAQLSTRGT